MGKGADFRREYEARKAGRYGEAPGVNDIIENDPIAPNNSSGEIDTRTSRPKQTGFDEYEGAGIGAEIKAGFVDDPMAKIRIYAAARFPDVPEKERIKRYGIRDGEIIFVDDTGELRLETPASFYGKAKRFFGETAAASPEIVGGTVGSAIGGPLGAMAGSAAGEAVRKGIGTAVFGDDQDAFDYAGDIGGAALLGGVSDLAGRAVTSKINASKMKSGGALRFGVGKDVSRGYISKADQMMAERVQNLADQAGIKLAPHQLYNKESMTNIWKYLRKHPATSDAVRQFEDMQSGQVEDAVTKKINDMMFPADTPDVVNMDLRNVAMGVIEDADAGRSNIANGMYQEAFADANPDLLDISPVIDGLEKELKKLPEADGSHGVIKRVKRMLQQVEKGKDGKTVVRPVNDLELINNAKFAIDDLISGTSIPAAQVSPSNKKNINRILNEAKENLLEIVDNVNPKYAAAREKYAELSPPIDRLRKSVIGEIASLEKDGRISTATAKLLSSGNIKHEKLMQYAKHHLSKKDPEIIKRAVGSYIMDTYETLKSGQNSGGDIINAAGKMHQKLFGSKRQKDILKAALNPEEFKSLDDLMTVFERVSIGKGNESMTMPFSEIQRQLSGSAGGKIATLSGAALTPMASAKRMIFDRWNDIIISGNQEKLFEALTNPEVTAIIKKMKPLSPDDKRLYRGLTAAMSMIAFDMGLGSAGRMTYEDIEPQAQQGRQSPTRGRQVQPQAK